MKNVSYKICGQKAFSLAEVLAALVIGAMVLIAVLGIYGRAEQSAAAITSRLDGSGLASEVLHRINEDLDGIATASQDIKITINNKLAQGYPTAQLIISKTYYDNDDQGQTFEEIIWRGCYDADTGGLIIYRRHSGIVLEDRLLDEKKEQWERELFVPICTGVTFFKIQIPEGENFEEQWTSNSLPNGAVITISFAEPVKKADGTLDVPDEEKITRTIAINRTRKIAYEFVKKEYKDSSDVNDKNTDNSDANNKDVNYPDVNGTRQRKKI